MRLRLVRINTKYAETGVNAGRVVLTGRVAAKSIPFGSVALYQLLSVEQFQQVTVGIGNQKGFPAFDEKHIFENRF